MCQDKKKNIEMKTVSGRESSLGTGTETAAVIDTGAAAGTGTDTGSNIAAGTAVGRNTARRHRAVLACWSFLTLLYSNAVLASASYGQNASSWFLEQMFWIVLVAVVIVVATLAAKRNFVGALTTALVGSVVVYFVKNPTKLEEIGNSIMNAIGM